MFSLFGKKKELRIPLPPSGENLPSFPSPRELEKTSFEDLDETSKARLSLEEHQKSASEKQKEELEEMHEHKALRPIFIHAPTYRALVDEIGQMKAKMSEAELMVETVEGFKADQDKTYRAWQSLVKEIHEKMIYIDETLFKR